MIDKPPVAFGKGDKRLRFDTRPPNSRAKIEKADPSRSLLQFQAIIITCSIIAIPDQALRRKTLLPEPLGERDPIERCNLGVVGAIRNGYYKRASSFGIPPVDPIVDLI